MSSNQHPATTADERNRERDRFVWLFNNCQERVGLYASEPDADRKHLWMENPPEDQPTRPLVPEDVTVTVKWSKRNNHLAHLGTIEGSDSFTLGIHFKRWRRQTPEQKLVTLGHELGHARYSGHEPYYWRFVFDIWGRILDHADTIETWFNDGDGEAYRPALLDDPVDWEYFRNRCVDDVYDNADPAIRDQMVEEAADRFEYPYEWVQALDWGRKYSRTTIRAPVQEWDGEARHVDPESIAFSRRYADEELVECYAALDDRVPAIDLKDIPAIRAVEEGDAYRVVENELHAALIARTAPREGTVPVVV